MLSSLSTARRRFVLGVCAVGVVAVLVVAAVVVTKVVDTADPVAQDEPGPVLLISGYGGGTTGLDVLARALRDQGRSVTIVPSVGNGTIDLRTQAERLAEAADAARDATGAESVDVIGYSAGGVVARLWVRDFGGDSVARRVVTLASPHHGTALAALAEATVPGQCPVACKQLATDSAFLTALNAGDETPDGPEFVSIWSTSDTVVTPADSARLDGALDFTVQSICGAGEVSHGQMPSSPAVLGSVPLLLGPTPPTLPTAKVCAA